MAPHQRDSPYRLDRARRAAVRGWLIRSGLAEEAADGWCDAWEAEAHRRGLERPAIDFWEDAGPWIAERLKSGNLPP
jgi:hypothetical protein